MKYEVTMEAKLVVYIYNVERIDWESLVHDVLDFVCVTFGGQNNDSTSTHRSDITTAIVRAELSCTIGPHDVIANTMEYMHRRAPQYCSGLQVILQPEVFIGTVVY